MPAQQRHSLFFGLCALIGATANGQSLPTFPTHCSPDEFSVVNARMGHIDNAQSQRESRLVIARSGKVLSLCADRPREPFAQFVYRYGPIGAIEFERIASVTRKIGINSRTTSPHTGDDIVFFSVGKLTYYVTIATAQGSGVSLFVFDANKKVLDLFSGNDNGTDYELGPAKINFFQATSPVFRLREPVHGF